MRWDRAGHPRVPRPSSFDTGLGIVHHPVYHHGRMELNRSGLTTRYAKDVKTKYDSFGLMGDL